MFTAAMPTTIWDVLETVAIPFNVFLSALCSTKDYCCILFPDRFLFWFFGFSRYLESFLFNELRKMLRQRMGKVLIIFLLLPLLP